MPGKRSPRGEGERGPHSAPDFRLVLDRAAARVAPAGVSIPESGRARLAAFLDLVVRWSERVNLVSRRELPALVEKHVLPSLSPLLAGPARETDIAPPFRLLDIGSGGGFPGLVLAVMRPAWSVTLLEPMRRKALFLETVTRELSLEASVTVVRSRVEDLARDPDHARRYHLVTARAVSPPVSLWPLARPLLAPDAELHVFIARASHEALAGALRATFEDVEVRDPVEPPWHPGAVMRLAHRVGGSERG